VRNRAAPSAIFFQNPKAILRRKEGEGRFLSVAPCLLLSNSEVSAFREFFAVRPKRHMWSELQAAGHKQVAFREAPKIVTLRLKLQVAP